MQVQVEKWGDDLAVRIPPEMVAKFEVAVGSSIEVVYEGRRLMAALDGVPVYSLEELLKGITPENRHPETDWGPDLGLEVIDDDYGGPTLI